MHLLIFGFLLLSGFALSSGQECATFTNQTSCCGTDGCEWLNCISATPECVTTANVTLCPFNQTSLCDTEPPTEAPTNGTETPDVTVDPESTEGPTAAPPTAAPTTNTPAPTAPPATGESSAAPTGTAIPATTTPRECDTSGQSFDAASFIGGIVLAIGVIGMMFLGCKFFRGKSEQNYQQF